MDFIIALLFVLLLLGVPIFAINVEKTKAVNITTIQCIENPNICKERYQYLKLAEKLEKNK